MPTSADTTPAEHVWSGDWSPRLVAFDLDDTLAPSKSALEAPMLDALTQLLEVAEVCVISGGQISQFRTQLIDALGHLDEEHLTRLHLMPTCGTQYWLRQEGEWREQYAENLTPEQIREAFESLEKRARELGVWEEETWGPILEDRGSQVTFSALGQSAPVDAKKAWDPDGAKKNALAAAVAKDLPELEVRSGGSTSVDITRRGIDKAYGMTRLVELTGIPVSDMLFVGDRLDEQGNDYPVLSTGVRAHAVHGWEDTEVLVRRVVERIRSDS